MIKTISLALVILACTIPAEAGNCPTSTLNNILGSSCSIGDVQFTFTSYSNSSGQVPASTVMFTPNGSNPEDPSFTLTGNFAANQSQPSSTGVEFGFGLNFQAEAIGQYLYLSGVGVELGGINVAPIPNAGGLNQIALSNCVGSCPSYQEATAWVLNSDTFLEDLQGSAEISPLKVFDGNLLGSAYAFNPLAPAYTGFSSAMASFAVDTQTPEPATLIMAGIGLLLLALQLRGKERHPGFN